MQTDDLQIRQKDSVVNIVTAADVNIQKFLQDGLTKLLPGSAFFGEEGAPNVEESEYIWIVDPIDGTMNYARNMRESAVSVGLVQKGKPALAVVYNPFKEELFTAIEGQGAWLGEERIWVSEASFDAGIFCTAWSLYNKDYAPQCRAVMEDVYRQSNDFRRFGSCALELCYLAAGRCDLFFEMRVFPWDHAAGGLILQEAGGSIGGLDGDPLQYDRTTPVIAANNRSNFDQLLKIVAKHVPEVPYREILIGNSAKVEHKEQKEKKLFTNRDYNKKKKGLGYTTMELESMFAQANAELGLQQSKRDQMIALYLAMFSFLLPFALSIEGMTPQIKGLVLFPAALIGMMFATVIQRYRIYKEIYWFCCQTIEVMTSIKPEERDKKTVQAIFYQVVRKKGKKWVLEDSKTHKRSFDFTKFRKDNLFSAETAYYGIHVFLTVLFTGISVGMMTGQPLEIAIPAGVAAAAAVAIWLMRAYFVKLAAVYNVLVDGLDETFNKIYEKAWFLHLFG